MMSMMILVSHRHTDYHPLQTVAHKVESIIGTF